MIIFCLKCITGKSNFLNKFIKFILIIYFFFKWIAWFLLLINFIKKNLAEARKNKEEYESEKNSAYLNVE